MEILEPFNPLNKKNLGLSVAEAMLQKPIVPLPPDRFTGAGIYAIYYFGDFEHYSSYPITRRDAAQPIYVGKAIPEGARRGGLGLDAPAGNVLYKRLNDHAKSIREVPSLDFNHFACRYLIVDDIWIPLGESLLIEMFRPLWNVVVDGFGNHDPGAGRYNQQRSAWDTLHPGRSWAEKCQPGRPLEELLQSIVKHMAP